MVFVDFGWDLQQTVPFNCEGHDGELMDGLVDLQLPRAARFHSRGLVLEQLGFMVRF
jgi:hypothetical protein